jgi:leucyl/phenylalanyl-tRNA--protein transferase
MEYRLTAELLLRAYSNGVFPMAESRGRSEIFWVDPEWRGIIPLDGFHVPRSLRRVVRRRLFDVRSDTAFDTVIRECAAPRRGRGDTWINDDIVRSYAELYRLGFAHSIECWQNDDLVGGLYGVSIGGAFFGESMFSRVTNASKVALVHLVARLVDAGFRLLDTQFVTEHLTQFGALEVPRNQYHQMLREALANEAAFPVDFDDDRVDAYLQSLTQMS